MNGIAEMLVNLSQEYSAIFDFILFFFAAVGVLISASGCYNICRLGDQAAQVATPVSRVLWKLLAGPLLVNLAITANALSASLWMNQNELGVDQFVSSGSSTWETARVAALGIMFLAGFITIGRAYMMAANLGSVSVESKSSLIGNIISRIVAGSALTVISVILETVKLSTGFSSL